MGSRFDYGLAMLATAPGKDLAVAAIVPFNAAADAPLACEGVLANLAVDPAGAATTLTAWGSDCASDATPPPLARPATGLADRNRRSSSDSTSIASSR